MKLSKRKLKKILLKEFKDTFDLNIDDFVFSGGGGTGHIPPNDPPRRGGGGDGGGGWNPNNNNPGRCSFGNPHYDRIYNQVASSFSSWVEMNFPLSQEEEIENQKIINSGDRNQFSNIATEYDKYISYITSMHPVFTQDLISEDFNEFFELLLTILAEYICKNNIQNIEDVFWNPIPAIANFL